MESGRVHQCRGVMGEYGAGEMGEGMGMADEREYIV